MMAIPILQPDRFVTSSMHNAKLPHLNGLRRCDNARLNDFGKHLPLLSIHQKKISTKQRKLNGTFLGSNDCRFIVSAIGGGSKDGITESETMKAALEEANARAEAAEKGRKKAIDELGRAEAKLQEYAANLVSNTELAVAELNAAKDTFHQQLQHLLDEKLAIKSELVLAKQDAIDLAVQVERFAEIAIQEATAHIVDEANLRVSTAETSAAEVTQQVEEKLRNAADGIVSTVVTESKGAMNKSLAIAEVAREKANQAQAALAERSNVLDKLFNSESSNISLKTTVHDLERELRLSQNKVERLQAELKAVEARLNAAEARAAASDKALLEFQESANRASSAQEEAAKNALDFFKKASAGREEALLRTYKLEMESMVSALDAAKKAESIKEKAYLRRFEALERALNAAEASVKAWKERSQTAELLLHKVKEGEGESQETEYVLNGGRMEFLIRDDKKRWNLLAHGPRRETPEWLAQRMDGVCPNFPPIKINVPEHRIEAAIPLDLPKVEEVWSIAKERTKEDDMFTKRAVEQEIIKKQRKTLERALQRKTVHRPRIPEETKLEPGTGTGREIVLQGFNWESCRRKWYQELAPKAADLSQSGITAVWFPPPTESVAPQGYMPLDYYNLSSAYGTQEELKQCIEEMHNHDLLALGDVVLNHRCAQKQSPNGVWNIFGGKLSWGPEAIVCDDPNFQGRGHPSSGDFFHAAPNIDHSQDFVRKDIKEWLNWLRTDIGFDGWRLDFARGFWGGYVKEYIEASNPAFSIGEYWDSLAYEGGNLCYNQDSHRQRIINWINATQGTSSAFDVTTKGILHSALHNQYWRLIDPQGKPTGVMGWWPSRAVTFLENHDTGSTQGHWPFPRDKLMQGYAYILTHPGTPVIFYDHFYDFGLHDPITELIDARTRAGIHCRSPVKIFHANNEGYVAQTGENLVIKLGQFDWNPSKQDILTGSWQKFVDKGADYIVWLRK
ncbi:uncharacterized protein LOC131035073 isoform X1 [Cryptomeria japonica]|uniref:uncharacterized protein LOC131035073 isoform X1 n=3 Tax=Cryptomeria japonica TaxID=3369 RepID=UPI0025AC27CD|nr:uncharacterized protein LOC131035073 isoform X1 [Cryptomeria japonica]